MTATDVDSSFELLALLADGKVHSGSDLALRLGVSRAAVWKRIAKLPELGVEVLKVRSRGYRLSHPIELLDIETIRRIVTGGLLGERLNIEILRQVGSTNEVLLERARAKKENELLFLLAEHQTRGRGRRGREWCSPIGQNIYMSALWGMEKGLQGLDGLSIAVGVSVATMLREDFGIPARLKWPNDVLVAGEKIAGILIELDGDLQGPLAVVIGIGLNVSMASPRPEQIKQPWTDMASYLPSGVSRSAVAGRLIIRLVAALTEFQHGGVSAFYKNWMDIDAYLGQDIAVIGPMETLFGVDRGIDEKGGLLVEVDGEIKRVVSGEVTLRAQR